jgi:ATP-dependent exoDNAse (exonuclease V) beta subunit
VTDLDTTVLVEAAAGTGKTSALVARIVALLRAGRARLGTLVAVTFTDKAAGELKLRLRAELEAAGLEQALAELEAARIGTIHALCADLLAEHPVAAGVDPLFEVAAGEEAERLLDQAFESWFQETLADPPEGVRRLLRRRPRGRPPREALRAAAARRVEHRDFDAPWRRDPLDREATLRAALAALPPEARELADDIARRGLDLDGIEAELAAAARRIPALADPVARLDADLAACLSAELGPLLARHAAVKARAGRLDFLDLLLRARALLQAAPEIGARYSHIFVDELQDTDPLQVDILLLLAGDPPAPGKLFVVGDPRQSIYRFRRADVAVYHGLKARLVAAGGVVVELGRSFRAVPSILAALNAAFPDGSPLAPARPEPVGPTLVALGAERPHPEAVAAFIASLAGRGVAPRDVCILLKRFAAGGADATQPYARALEARAIPHVLVGGRSFHAREEVAALRNAAAAIEYPDDALAIFAALRGPFFGLSDDELLVGDGPAAEARALLAELRATRNQVPIADTLARLLAATRAHAGLALWPNGEQALANVARVLDKARRFDGAGATSFRAFVRWLEAEVEGADAVDEGADGVRIMTVHRAKGLEFPVVVLGDPAAPAAPRLPTRHMDAARRLWVEPLAGCVPVELLENAEAARAADLAEARRLAYVAATRARDLLVLPAVADGWLAPLSPLVAAATPWDPGPPEAAAKRDLGLRMPDVLVDGPASADAARAHAAWQEERGRIRAAAARSTVALQTVRVAADGAPPADALEVRRGAPFWLRRPDGTVVEGVVDLAYRDAGGWVVVARDPAALELGVAAVAAATGAPVRGIIAPT